MAVVVASLVTVSFAYQRESMARKHEYQSRLSALYSLAVSHQREAERQGQEKRWLASRLHAAASLMNNPAHLSSPAYDRGFARRHSPARLLEVKALGNIQRSDHRHIRGRRGRGQTAWIERARAKAHARYYCIDGIRHSGQFRHDDQTASRRSGRP